MTARGKRNDTGEWVEGYFFAIGKETAIIPPSALFVQGVEIDDVEFVDPETVGRYVCNDCNGNRAFEGDIIKNNLGDDIGVIRFGEYRNTFNDDEFAAHVGFYVEWHGNKAAHLLRKDVGFWLNMVPVIGNIHDNPELLRPAGDHADNGALSPAT